jgi:uncharacterized iron-regulated membrane protein
MLETISHLLLALLACIVVGGAIVGYVVWRSRKAQQDQAAKMAQASGGSGGGGGPTEPA